MFPWQGRLPTFQHGDHIKADMLIRNVSKTPKKVSTLAALDGAGAVITDEKKKRPALLSLPFTGTSTTQRYLLQPREVVRIKQPHFVLSEGDLHPLTKNTIRGVATSCMAKFASEMHTAIESSFVFIWRQPHRTTSGGSSFPRAANSTDVWTLRC